MIITYIGMASIFLGFLCVMGAFWLFHNREDELAPESWTGFILGG